VLTTERTTISRSEHNQNDVYYAQAALHGQLEQLAPMSRALSHAVANSKSNHWRPTLS